MSKRQGIRAILFILCTITLFLWLSYIFVSPEGSGMSSRFHDFYKKEKENTWDAAFLGSSVVSRAWAAPVAWHEHGLAIYSMATDSQLFLMTTDLMEEVLKKQNVPLFIIDLRGLRESKTGVSEVKVRRLTDNMEYSTTRTAALKKVFQYIEEKDIAKDKDQMLNNKLSYYIPFIKYHTNWNGLQETNFVKPTSEMKGVYEGSAFKTVAQAKPETTTKASGLSNDQIELLEEVIRFGKEHNVELLFTMLPGEMSKKEQKEINQAFQIINENGFRGINFNQEAMYQEVGIDFSKDFYDPAHVNAKGARKISEYLGKYISQNYDFTDKRGREEYTSWDQAWELYNNFYNIGWTAQ